ncbi:MAG: trypsin-like peptidase domain-containing protein [Candidatus Omnitrophica bacterium]|nr:trypsin-like peptidase domain-containing protein [Candidatus Omnitrophota bacterium]
MNMSCSKILLALTVSFLLTSPMQAHSARSETPLSNIQSYQDSVVTVKAQQVSLDGHRATVVEKSGAGVIIDASGLIITNTHIIYGANIIKIVFKDGTSLNARVPFISREYDFSILSIDPPSQLKPIEWADSDKVELGQPVITIGHSPLLDQTISGGQVNGLGTRTQEDGSVTPEMIKISINHYPGDSGGPVFDTAGKLIGLMNAKQTNRQRAALAVPANKIHLEYLKLVNPSETR